MFKVDDVCWLASSPFFAPRGYDEPEQAKMYISFFMGFPEPQISYFLDGYGRANIYARSGAARMELFEHNLTYFPRKRGEEHTFLVELLRNSQVDLLSLGSTQTLFSFSLTGLLQAYNYVTGVFGFKAIGSNEVIG